VRLSPAATIGLAPHLSRHLRDEWGTRSVGEPVTCSAIRPDEGNPQSQGLSDLEHDGKAGIALAGEGRVQAFARYADLAGELAHVAGAGGWPCGHFRAGFQPSSFSLGAVTQGDALGWYRAGLRPSGAKAPLYLRLLRHG